MSASEIFRTEFKGYNKKEVIDYISSMNSQMEALKAELDRVESELEKCQAELKAAPESEQTPTIDVDAVRAEAYEQAKRELEEKAPSDELAELREKAEMYDKQKELIADIVITAKTNATEILENAEKRAAKLLDDAYDKFDKAREDFVQMRRNVEAGKAELDTRIAAVSHYLNDFSQYLNILEKDVINTGENFKENM